MTKPSKCFVIDVPIYNQNILFIIHVADKDLIRKTKGKIDILTKEAEEIFIEPLLKNTSTTAARTVMYSNGAICVRFYDIYDILTAKGLSCIAHELVHVCSYIFDRIGMTHNSETEEAYAYLYGHIFEKIINEL